MKGWARHHPRSLSLSFLWLILFVEVPAWAVVPPRHLADLGREARLLVQRGSLTSVEKNSVRWRRDLTKYRAGYWNNIGPRSLEATDTCGIQAPYP